MPIEKEKLARIKKRTQLLVDSRASMARGDGAGAGDASSFRIINDELEKLAAEVGVSGAALEFWLHPVGVQGTIDAFSVASQPLNRAERVIENVNVQLALELKQAGLI